MAIGKEHKEFHTVDTNTGWLPIPGYPEGIQEKILAGSLDEVNGVGSRTRLLRFLPGAHTTTPFVHKYWEEVFLVDGDLIVGGGKERGEETFRNGTYACRPPGVAHGPFKSNDGCLLLEIHYFHETMG